MEIYELNEDEKLILELLEGNLDEESRQVAFQKLAYNPNLQEDFLDYISIDKAIDFDANQVTVPIEYTNEIFAKAENMQPLSGKFLESLKRTVMTGIFALLMLLPLFFGLNNGGQNNQSHYQTSKAEKQISSLNNISTNQNKITNNFQNDEQKKIGNKGNSGNKLNSITRKPIQKKLTAVPVVGNQVVNMNSLSNNPIFVERKIPQRVNTELLINNNSQNIAFADIDNFQQVSFQIKKTNEIGKINSNKFDLQNFKVSKREIPPVLVQYHINSAITNPVKNMQKNSSVFGNYCVSVFLETFPKISFGAEFGNEAFSQIYLNSANSTEYTQTPNVLYFGVAARYDANQWKILNIHPVAQLFAGGSSLGPLTRASMQLEYNGIKYFGIYCGVDGGFLLYSDQGKWLSSKKIGAIIGANFKF